MYVNANVVLPTNSSILWFALISHARPALVPDTRKAQGNKKRHTFIDLEEEHTPVNTTETKTQRGKKTKNGKSSNDEDTTNTPPSGRGEEWSDHQTVNLIHIRGALEEEFNKPPKQGS